MQEQALIPIGGGGLWTWAVFVGATSRNMNSEHQQDPNCSSSKGGSMSNVHIDSSWDNKC